MRLLVAIDFSDITETVISHSAKLAKALQAELFLVHVAEPNPDHIAYDFDPASVYAIDPKEVRDSIAERFHKEHQTLQQYADRLREDDISCTALMVQGGTIDMLAHQAEKLEVDFIVAGTHGKGLISQVLLGSTSEELVRKSTLPVHLVPAG